MSAATQTDAPEMARTRFAKDQLKAFVERIERLEEEKKAIADDIRDVYAESKANGFDTTALRAIIKLRKQEPTERNEQQLILDTYMSALGMLPLFDRDPPSGGEGGGEGGGKGGAGGGRGSKAGPKHGASMKSPEPAAARGSQDDGSSPSAPAVPTSEAAGPVEAASDGASRPADLPSHADPDAVKGGAHHAPAQLDLSCLESTPGERERTEPGTTPSASNQGPAPPQVPDLSHVAVERRAAEERQGQAGLGVALPPATCSTPSIVEIADDDDGGVPPILRIGHPLCWRTAHTGPPDVRPP